MNNGESFIDEQYTVEKNYVAGSVLKPQVESEIEVYWRVFLEAAL